MAEETVSRRVQNSQISGSRSRANSPKIFDPIRNYGESPNYNEVTSLNNSQHSLKKSINTNPPKIFDPPRKYDSPRNDHLQEIISPTSLEQLRGKHPHQQPQSFQHPKGRGKMEGYYENGGEQEEENQVTLSAYLRNLKNVNNSQVQEKSAHNMQVPRMDNSQHGFEESHGKGFYFY
jgi:hypothetical protein